jgi:C4-dicarboxylate transporter DctM subunit
MTLALSILVLTLVAGMLLRMPIGFSMLASGIAYLLVKRQDIGLVAEQVCNGLYNSYVLLAVPLFVFAANIMNAGTVSERIFDFCRILVGRLRGGLAQVDILVSVIFSGMSGSAIADAAGPGLVTIRQMLKKPEYSRGFAGAVVVASATLGPIIPPSIPMVIYALVSGASVGALFLGGVVPGFLMAVLMMVVVHFIATMRNMPREPKVPLRQWPAILYRGALPLSMPIVLLGGIYSGAFTPTEAAAVAALHALILAGVVYRALNWRSFWGVVMESTRGSAVITIILAGSFMLNYAFTAEGVPQAMAQWVDSMHLSQLKFLLLVNVMFLALGCFLDVSVLLLVFVPMLLPAAKLLGVDLGAFWRAGGAQHDDWPDSPAVWHAAFRHQGAHRHSDWRDDA